MVVRPRSIERKQGTVEVEILEITENTDKKRNKEEDHNLNRSLKNIIGVGIISTVYNLG